MTPDLTIIITTSPTPSAPSTELLSDVLESFKAHCPSLLAVAAIIVVFDTYDHVTGRSRLKRGQVTPEVAASYDEYKRNVKELISTTYLGNDGSCDKKRTTRDDGIVEFGSREEEVIFDLETIETDDKIVSIVEPRKRIGFGLAVRTALRMTKTRFVWVQQHDWALSSSIPMDSMIALMNQSISPPIRYITVPALRILNYTCDLRSPVFRTLTKLHCRSYETADSAAALPLTPFFSWHDKPHLATTEHYLSQVFPSRISLSRGDFIEDRIGNMAREEMKDGMWEKWATWLYFPGDGKQLCLKHLQGRFWRGREEEGRMKTMYQALNMEARLEQAGDAEDARIK